MVCCPPVFKLPGIWEGKEEGWVAGAGLIYLVFTFFIYVFPSKFPPNDSHTPPSILFWSFHQQNWMTTTLLYRVADITLYQFTKIRIGIRGLMLGRNRIRTRSTRTERIQIGHFRSQRIRTWHCRTERIQIWRFRFGTERTQIWLLVTEGSRHCLSERYEAGSAVSEQNGSEFWCYNMERIRPNVPWIWHLELSRSGLMFRNSTDPDLKFRNGPTRSLDRRQS